MKEIPKPKRVLFWTRFTFPIPRAAIGFRICGETFRAVAVNWDADEESELDERISQLITDALLAADDLDEIAAYCRIFPETILFQPELSDHET